MQNQTLKTVSLPFDFKYYGNTYDDLRICSNGWIALGGGNKYVSDRGELPYPDDVNNMVACLWKSFFFQQYYDPDCAIFYYYDQANHRFIVQWHDMSDQYGMHGDPYKDSFQAVLFDPDYYPTPTGDGEIIVQYKEVEEYDGFTIGIENDNQDVGLDYCHNRWYPETAEVIRDEYAVKFTTHPPTLAVTDVEDDVEIAANGIILYQNYPNPVSSTTEITFYTPTSGDANLYIRDLLGRKVATVYEGDVFSGLNRKSINLQDVAPGTYFITLEIQSGGEVSVENQKFVIQR
jgi:hypothetical protein